MRYEIGQSVDILCHDGGRVKGRVSDIWNDQKTIDIDPGDGLCEVTVNLDEIAHDALLDAGKPLSDDEARSTLDDYKQLGDEMGTDALAMVADYMQRSAASTNRMQASLYEGEVAAHAETKALLRDSERQLFLVRQRLTNLVFAPPTEYERYHLLGEQP